MKSLWRRYQRIVYVFVAASLILGTYIPVFLSGSAYAATQLEPRSIQMSDSSPSNNATIPTGVGSGTSVLYKFTITNAHSMNSMAINFCDNSPIIGDTCLLSSGSLNGYNFTGQTSPGSMNVSSAAIGTGANAPTTTCGGGSGNKIGGTGWSISEPNNYTVLLTSGGSNTVCAGTQTFTLTGITNPQLAYSFYARMYDYSSNTPGTASPTAYSSPTVPGSYQDYGGVALSTVTVITITAKVQESLSFCVTSALYATWTTTGDCSDPNVFSHSPSATLGTIVGSNVILQPESPATATDQFQLSTNATSGAVLYLHSSNTCGGLSVNGGTDGCPIAAVGDYAPAGGEANAYSLTTAATNDGAIFGAQLGTSSDGTQVVSGLAGTGSLTDLAPYNGSGMSYGMDDTAVTGVVGTYGNEIADTTAPCYLLDDTISFGATSALTTPAGIYTTNISLIATGEF